MGAWGTSLKFREMTDAQYIERLKSKCVIDEKGCWLFQGFLGYKGYGQTSFRGQKWATHRLSYRLHKGEIPKGMLVCHRCDVRNCCNPDHLWLGTNDDNQLDAWKKGRKRNQSAETCDRGHPYTPENTRRYKPNFRRTCLTCQRGRMRIEAGWPEDLAYSVGRTPKGYRPVNAPYKQARVKRASLG